MFNYENIAVLFKFFAHKFLQSRVIIYLNFQDLPLSKMSVAELKEEGDKALHKDDYNVALEFYNAVLYCTIQAPEVHFSFPTIVSSFISLKCLASLSDVFLDKCVNYRCALCFFVRIFLQGEECKCEQLIVLCTTKRMDTPKTMAGSV